MLSELSIERLNELKKFIGRVPEKLNMDDWGSVCDPNFYEEADMQSAVVDQRPPCGTVGCLAGNTVIMAGIVKPRALFDGGTVYELEGETPRDARDYLEITEEQADRLFYLKSWNYGLGVVNDEEGNPAGWPDEFEERLSKYQPGTSGYLRATLDRIDHFIATFGDE